MAMNEAIESAFRKVYSDFWGRINSPAATFRRTLCFGYGINILLDNIRRDCDNKIFILNEDTQNTVSGENIVTLSGEVADKLAAFPPNTFSLIVSTWSPRVVERAVAEQIKNALKSDGVFGLLIAEDNSPKQLYDLLKEMGYRAKTSHSPKNISNLRNMLESSGFLHTRIWEGNMTFSFNSANECLSNLELMGGGVVFQGLDDAECQKLRSMLLSRLSSTVVENGAIRMEYSYLGAICAS